MKRWKLLTALVTSNRNLSHILDHSHPPQLINSLLFGSSSPLVHLVHTLLLCSLGQCSAALSGSPAFLVFLSPTYLPSCYKRIIANEKIWSSNLAELSRVAAHCWRTKPMLLSWTLNTVIICLPLQAHCPPLHQQPSGPTILNYLLSHQAGSSLLPLFTLFQNVPAPAPSFQTQVTLSHPSRLRCLISAHGHLLWLPYPTQHSMHSTLSLSSRSTMPPQNCPSVISMSLKYKPFEETMPYFSPCTHD